MSTKDKRLEQYRKSYSIREGWPLISNVRSDVDNVVVIPALAESGHLFETLESLSRNPGAELGRTLIICVVNNRAGASPEEIKDNQRTLDILRRLVEGRKGDWIDRDTSLAPLLHNIMKSTPNLGYVDASSPGCEMPDRTGGVGLARKIGFDRALEIFDYEKEGVKLLYSLDADTLVEDTYLSAVRDYFEKTESAAAVVSFAHQRASSRAEEEAICCYETFLRSYVLGLVYAGSRYAYHSIGSTIACTVQGYTAVRGMNRRKAGEDFYFLNKLAKIRVMGLVTTTKVYPSSRYSNRVPFGTGKKVEEITNGMTKYYRTYDPTTFVILKKWLDFMSSRQGKNTDGIIGEAKKIHPSLGAFLEENHFEEVWPRLVENTKSPEALSRNFDFWFDGFKQYKLIRYITVHEFPMVNMVSALEKLLEMMGEEMPIPPNQGEVPSLDNQKMVLDYLRHLELNNERIPRSLRRGKRANNK
ncbi:MAG: hypothetical protein E4H39_00285 [Syntrophobacterales bacterium]|nr:MAG: hypothetical protein E4H39_00285 [Syntrophobacterales bacterium]